MKAILSLVDCTPEGEQMSDEDHELRPRQRGPLIDASHILSALFILLLAGVFTVGWNTSREVLVIGKDVSFMRQQATETKIENANANEELRAEIARLENHFNTAWARIRAMEQKMNMPIDRNEYNNSQ